MGGFSDYIPVFRLLQDVILHQRYYLSIKIRRGHPLLEVPSCLPPSFVRSAECDSHKERRTGAARGRFRRAVPEQHCAKAWPGGQKQQPTGKRQGALSASTAAGLPKAWRCAKRPFGETSLFRYNARLACLHLQRRAGAARTEDHCAFGTFCFGSASPRHAQALWPAGSHALAWDRPPVHGGSSQPGGQCSGRAKRAQNAAAGSSRSAYESTILLRRQSARCPVQGPPKEARSAGTGRNGTQKGDPTWGLPFACFPARR